MEKSGLPLVHFDLMQKTDGEIRSTSCTFLFDAENRWRNQVYLLYIFILCRKQMEKSRQYEKELFLVIRALEEEGVLFLSDDENIGADTT